MKKNTKKMLEFVGKGKSPYHVIANLKESLLKNGYEELDEKKEWKIKMEGNYFVTRNGSSIIAFSIPKGKCTGFHMAASHSDSPSFKVKENPEMPVEEQYIKLNTEKYGGMILSTWLDRPLSIAGRVMVETKQGVESRLVDIDKDLLVIPNVAIHMNRDMNKGVEYNAQVDMLPLFSGMKEKGTFLAEVSKAAGVKADEILSHDLFLYAREPGKMIGVNEEYILSPRLDDLECVYATMSAMMSCTPKEYVNLCAVFDNEEVGSGTRQGADSTFLEDAMVRISEGLGLTPAQYRQLVAGSFLISADNAHAVHPNHPEKADPTNRPYLNGGVVIKYHGSQKYTTDAETSAMLKSLCNKAGVPYQTYCNRSDIMGGSTLGNISTAHVSVPSVDIGLPQLAMHSAVETAGAKDTEYAITMLEEYFAQ